MAKKIEMSGLDWVCEQITHAPRRPDEFTIAEAAQKAFEKTGQMPTNSSLRNKFNVLKSKGVLECRPYKQGQQTLSLWRVVDSKA
jgi:hypothetical protein